MHTAPGMHVIICFTHSCSLLLSTGILYHKLRGNNKKLTVFYAFECITYSQLLCAVFVFHIHNSLISSFFLCLVKSLITSFIDIVKAGVCVLDEAAANAHSQHSVHFQKADCTDTLQYRIQQLLQLDVYKRQKGHHPCFSLCIRKLCMKSGKVAE